MKNKRAKIVTPYSRVARLLLHMEWMALRIGFGSMCGVLIGLIIDGWLHHPIHGSSAMVLLIGGVCNLGVGIWQPTHRQMGIIDGVYIGNGRWMKEIEDE